MEKISKLILKENQMQVLIVGSKEHITSTIYRFYRLEFAEVYEWSKIVPVPNSDKMMSVLTIDMP